MKRSSKIRLVNGAIVFLCLLLVWVDCWLVGIAIQHSRYDARSFNCVDFTRETMGFFDMVNIRSYQVVGSGMVDGKMVAHSWVGIDTFFGVWHFEPQELCFFDPYEEYSFVYVCRGV